MPLDGHHRVIAQLRGPWPLRARLTTAFVAVMAAVLVLGGGFVYVRFSQSLDDAVTQGLRSRAIDLQARSTSEPTLLADGRSTLTERGERFAQRLSADGSVLDATPGLRASSLLTGSQLRRVASGGEVLLDRESTPAADEPVRLLGVQLPSATGPDQVLVVGASIEASRDAVTDLAQLFLLGGPFVLLLASLAGYLLAGAALRPVELMRARAEAIRASEPGERLPVPQANDEIRRLGITLNDLLARLEEAVEVERTFVSDASHELRTPLAILKAELEFALRPARTADERHEALQAAAVETDRLVRLAEDLLVIARAQSGGLALRPAPVDLHDLLTIVAARFERVAGEGGVEVVVSTPAEGLELVGDRVRLEQALGNLVDNALGHGARQVTLSAVQAGQDVELRVADDGEGFPADFLPHAFARFTRADKARQRGGSGLGLAIVDTIARAHGGRAAAKNLLPQGAQVAMVLPRQPHTHQTSEAETDHARVDR